MIRNLSFRHSALLFSCFVIAVSNGLALFNLQPVSAVNANDFNPGRIIDDGVFTNKGSMGWEAIQRFLNNKGVSCQNYQAPCLKNFTEGGKTAAQIIYDAGQEYDINPQVLIVLVQKEVGLVTDTRPENWQYKTATGYACPDSTPGVCNSSYFGFTNQVRAGARMFHKIMVADPGWYTPYIVGTNSIPWNPNAGCGRSTVQIQNRATQALYNYTPYRPNQAALNAGYGSGDGCSSYGNRNFFLYFNDWFGVSSSPLIRTYESGDLYFYDGTRRYYIPNIETVGQYGIDGSFVRFISQSEMNAIPNGDNGYSPILKRLIKSDTSGGIYLLDRATRFYIGSMELLNGLGYTTDMITVLPSYIAESYPMAANGLSYFFQAQNGSVSKVENLKKRPIFEQAVLDNEIQGSTLTPLSDYNLAYWPIGEPIVYTDYLARNGAGTIRYYSGGSYRYIPGMESYNCWNLSAVKMFNVDFSLTNGQDSGALSCIAKNSSNIPFLLSGASKYQLPNQTNLQAISSATDNMLNRIPSGSLSTVLYNPTNGAISMIENNVKRPVLTMDIYYRLAIDPATMTRLTNEAYNSLPTGNALLPIGTLVRDSNGNAYVVTGSSSKKHISSMDTFNSFGYQWNSVLTINNSDSSYYATDPTPLSNITSDASTGDKYFMTDGYAYKLTASTGTPSQTYQSIPTAVLDRANKVSNLRFAASTQTGAMYYFQGGSKHYITSWQSYLQLSNGGQEKVYPINQVFLDMLTTGSAV